MRSDHFHRRLLEFLRPFSLLSRYAPGFSRAEAARGELSGPAGSSFFGDNARFIVVGFNGHPRPGAAITVSKSWSSTNPKRKQSSSFGEFPVSDASEQNVACQPSREPKRGKMPKNVMAIRQGPIWDTHPAWPGHMARDTTPHWARRNKKGLASFPRENQATHPRYRVPGP